MPYDTIEPDLNAEIALVLWIHEFTVGVPTLHVVEAKDGTVLLLPPVVGCDHGLSAFLQCPRVVEEMVITIVVFGGIIVLHFQGTGEGILFPIDQLFDPFYTKRLEGEGGVIDRSIKGSTVQEVDKHTVGNTLLKDVGFVEIGLPISQCEGPGLVAYHRVLHVMVGIPQFSQRIIQRRFQT